MSPALFLMLRARFCSPPGLPHSLLCGFRVATGPVSPGVSVVSLARSPGFSLRPVIPSLEDKADGLAGAARRRLGSSRRGWAGSQVCVADRWPWSGVLLWPPRLPGGPVGSLHPCFWPGVLSVRPGCVPWHVLLSFVCPARDTLLAWPVTTCSLMLCGCSSWPRWWSFSRGWGGIRVPLHAPDSLPLPCCVWQLLDARWPSPPPG